MMEVALVTFRPSSGSTAKPGRSSWPWSATQICIATTCWRENSSSVGSPQCDLVAELPVSQGQVSPLAGGGVAEPLSRRVAPVHGPSAEFQGYPIPGCHTTACTTWLHLQALFSKVLSPPPPPPPPPTPTTKKKKKKNKKKKKKKKK